jgi:hypothetical protein
VVVVPDRVADEPHIDSLTQLSQLPEGIHTGLEPRERYLVLHPGGWQLIIMALLP